MPKRQLFEHVSRSPNLNSRKSLFIKLSTTIPKSLLADGVRGFVVVAAVLGGMRTRCSGGYDRRS